MLHKDLKERFANVTVIGIQNFTRGAQTSDGVHHLMDVNYFNAQYVLHAAALMKEGNLVSFTNQSILVDGGA